jgi:hypothetical protein
MRTISLYLMLLGAAVAGSGCGAIFNGTHQTIEVSTDPEQVRVEAMPGGGAITTPASLRLSRSNEYTLTFTKEGYQPATMHVEKHLQAGILVLDLFAGLIGIAVDAGTGAWNSLSPDSATVTLTRTSASLDGPPSILVQVAREAGGIGVESSAPGVGVSVEASGGK